MSRTIKQLQAADEASVSQSQKAWTSVSAEVLSVSAERRVVPNVDLQLAGSALQAAVTALQAEEPHARVAAQIAAGEIPADLLSRAERLGRAAFHVRRMLNQTAAQMSEAKVPAALAETSKDVRDRMFKLLDYYFETDPEIGPRLAFIREGTGYLDRANDLEGLADLYDEQHAVVSHDLKHYRPDDKAAARRLAHEIHVALGMDSRADATNWNEVQSQLWPLMLASWTAVARLGTYLLPSRADSTFGSIVTLARGLAPRSAPAAKPSSEPKPA